MITKIKEIVSEDSNDDEILSQFRFGDETAFTDLYNRYHKGVYTYVMSFVKTPHLAEDLVHEVFIKIWEKRQELIITKSFTSYIYRIAHNIALDNLKKISKDERLRKDIIQWLEPSFSLLDNKSKDPNFYEELYMEAVSALTPQRQKVFILCREKGKTYDETAATLGISRNTVKEHMVKSLSFLRSFLYEKGVYLIFSINFIEF